MTAAQTRAISRLQVQIRTLEEAIQAQKEIAATQADTIAMLQTTLREARPKAPQQPPVPSWLKGKV